jgi:hypothetical protein
MPRTDARANWKGPLVGYSGSGLSTYALTGVRRRTLRRMVAALFGCSRLVSLTFAAEAQAATYTVGITTHAGGTCTPTTGKGVARAAHQRREQPHLDPESARHDQRPRRHLRTHAGPAPRDRERDDRRRRPAHDPDPDHLVLRRRPLERRGYADPDRFPGLEQQQHRPARRGQTRAASRTTAMIPSAPEPSRSTTRRSPTTPHPSTA